MIVLTVFNSELNNFTNFIIYIYIFKFCSIAVYVNVLSINSTKM